MIKSTNQQHYARLVAALETLENFTKKNSKEPIAHIFHQQIPQGGTFQKILGLGHCFIKATLSKETRQTNEKRKLQEESQVLHALNEVNRFHPLVDKDLANRLSKAINQYNEIVERSKTTPTSWDKRLLKFLLKKSQLSLSRTHKFELRIDETVVSSKINSELTSRATDRELDAFRTKAISLLTKSGIPIQVILQSIRTVPIEVKEEDSTITLEQKLSETVIIKGVFERYPGSGRSIPKSFRIDTK